MKKKPESEALSRREVLAAAGGLAGLAMVGGKIQAAEQRQMLIKPGKLLVIHDKDGHIISATHMTQPPVPKGMKRPAKIGAGKDEPHHKHNEKLGHTVAVLDIPAIYHEQQIHKVLSQVHVDVKNRKLIAKPK